MSNGESRGGAGVVWGIITLVVIVLAFLVGRLTAPAPTVANVELPELGGAPQQADNAFKMGTADGKWTFEEDMAFTRALAGLNQANQLKQLNRLATLVNGGKLKLELDPVAPAPATCCTPCSAQSSAAQKGPAAK